jgi:hypothetical protein
MLIKRVKHNQVDKNDNDYQQINKSMENINKIIKMNQFKLDVGKDKSNKYDL